MRTVLLTLVLCGIASCAGLEPVTEASYNKVVASQKGKVVLVNFWATFCVPCRAEMPALVKLAKKYQAKGLVLMTITADEPEDEARALEFLNKNQVPAPHYIRKAKSDDAFIQMADPKWSGALPASFIFDRSGKKVKSYFGETDLNALEAMLQKLF